MTAPLKIATFNVNSVRARLPNVLSWLNSAKPDLVLLQEIKVETDLFPTADFAMVGYNAHVHGQKSYNGVAVLYRQGLEISLVRSSLPSMESDEQARYLQVKLGANGPHFINIYAPNGNPIGTEKFDYKLRWLAALHAHAQTLLAAQIPFLIAGDYNIIPTALDCVDERSWLGDALYQPESHKAWRRLCHLGLTDAYRALHPDTARAFTFWDYQAGAWQRDNGIRIDHCLLSPQLADLLETVEIDKAPRGEDKASDHTPLLVTLRGLAPDRAPDLALA